MKLSSYFSVVRWMAGGLLLMSALVLRADTYAYLTGVPDYNWYAGCFGTACGNLMGHWDRHGMPNFYTGPTAGGVAPLHSCGDNVGIFSMLASKAGLDGRPANMPGHVDDYWSSYTIDFGNCGNVSGFSYESPYPDPFKALGRPEHTPDCIGDFIGLSQNKWTNMAGECSGNIDAYSFVFWDKTGRRRANHYTTNTTGQYIPDVGSGLQQWARYRGYDADVFTQLTSFNPERTTTNGFTYEDVQAEINAGYPVLCFLQPTTEFHRSIGPMTNANPDIHGVMIYGLYSDASLAKGVLIRTSWGSGDGYIMDWSLNNWLGLFPVRGVIGFHPKPKVTQMSHANGQFSLTWDAPDAQLYDANTRTTTDLHAYVVERSATLNPPNFVPVATNTTHSITLPDGGGASAFFRVRLTRR